MASATMCIPLVLSVLLASPLLVSSVVVPAGSQGTAPAEDKLAGETRRAYEVNADASVDQEDKLANETGQEGVAAESALKAFHKTSGVAVHSMRSTEHAQAAAPAEDGIAEKTQRARAAAESARNASRQTNAVAAHAMRITEDAQAVLKNAHKAVHTARVESEGLTRQQRGELERAEERLSQATKAGQYSNATSQRERVLQRRLQEKMEEEAKQHKQWKAELEDVREEVRDLRKELDGTEQAKELKDIEEMLKELSDTKATKTFSHEELKTELERLREAVRKITHTRDRGAVKVMMGPKTEAAERMVAFGASENAQKASAPATEAKDPEASPSRSGIDVDFAMPYGAIEPFGREDTAQELTEASIRESDAMVDQLERAEVAEEKRATFRALTRLRGAAIASYDGVARSQTGNVDAYSKLHKWRTAHPLRHLAQEESDISKWAFPDANL